MFAIVRRFVTACLPALLFATSVATSPTAQETAKPLWSGRFDVEPNKALLAWGASFSFDRRLFEDDVNGSLAWAEALARAGVLTTPDADAIRRGLTSILESGRADAKFLSGADEDVHSFVERVLVESADLCEGIDVRSGKNLSRPRVADAEDVSESDAYLFIIRYVDSSNTCHGVPFRVCLQR